MATYTNKTGDLTDLKLAAGDILNYTYTGTNPSIILPKGTYTFEVYGASGGSSSSYSGGKGGYSVGTLTISELKSIYFAIGEYPTSVTNTTYAGGYNGGGLAYAGSLGSGRAGGGATHMAYTSGLLSTLSGNIQSIIIVAGGGGGATSGNDGAGAGGGISGSDASGSVTATLYGKGGTQTAGGQGGYSDSTLTGGTGSFGQGGRGSGSSSDNYYGGGAGGGGFYGGGGGSRMPGGGGSGYISSVLTNASTTNGVNAVSTSGSIKITVVSITPLPPLNVISVYKKVSGTWIKQ